MYREIYLLHEWMKTAPEDGKLFLRNLQTVNRADVVARWIEFIRDVQSGRIRPSLRQSLTPAVLRSEGREAFTRDVKVYLGFMLVASADAIDIERMDNSTEDDDSDSG